MENLIKISAIAIAFNEEARIQSYLDSLWFADEIIIVDSHSTDKTADIALKNEKVRLFQRDFDNFSAQKNFALQQAKNDWIVFFDLDEDITKPLSEEIIETLKNPKSVAYFVNRDFYFMGKKIKYSGFQNDSVIRVYNKKHCQYNPNLVHEVLKVNGETEVLKTKLPHYSYKDFDSYMQKLHKYSALQGKMLYDKKRKPTFYHFLFRPWWRFFHQYFIRLGILDGKEGFILAYTSAFATFKRYVNLWMLYRRIE